MAKLFQLPKGTRDILPDEQPYWMQLDQVIREITQIYGYEPLSLPIFEDTALYKRGVGEATDIVEKEMYTFSDKADNSITLRPEFTAGVVRSYIQHGMASWPTPVKLWNTGPVFRYERPQAGRFRQFHQFNAEAIGEQDPALDFEIMDMAWQLYDRLQFQNLSFQLNSIGCPDCRPGYLKVLKSYYKKYFDSICDDCRNRLDKNPLRLLDCKQDRCQPVIEKAPAIYDHLCEACAGHFNKLREYLNAADLTFTLNHCLVRGLDYYTKTVFEVWAEGVGSQNAVCGGGRYDGLVELLGGKPTPAVGFAAGLDRTVMIMQNKKQDRLKIDPSVYFACQHAEARKQAIIYVKQLRERNISCLMGLGERSFKAQFREADRRNVRYVVIIGDAELESRTVILKKMETGEQKSLNADQLIRHLDREPGF
ncbi:histidine--tRNA ligase [bacterium]|nr:histidine--tRNA ligase [bacterium]